MTMTDTRLAPPPIRLPEQAWVCDNCATTNVVRRKRCGDCGTSRA